MIGVTKNGTYRPRLLKEDGSFAGFKGLKYTWGIPGQAKPAFSGNKIALIECIKYMKAANKLKEKEAGVISALSAI